MDILYRKGECSAEDIREQLPNPPSNSAVRAMLSTLKQKEYIRSREENFRYVYSPLVEKDAAQQTALDRLVNTFFGGSTAAAVNALLGMQSQDMSEEELNDLKAIIDNAKKEESEVENEDK